MAKQSKNTKERSLWAYATVATNGKGRIEIGLDQTTGAISFPTAISGSVKSVMSYERHGPKEKTVFQYPSVGNLAHLSEYEQVKEQFDVLGAIDTNTLIVEDSKLSPGCVYWTPEGIGSPGQTCLFERVGTFALLNVREGVNPEVIGWHCFLSQMWPKMKPASSSRLGLITDSELGRHDSYNDRRLPYYANYQLPRNVRILCASSDACGGLANKAIRTCDETSKKLLTLNSKNAAFMAKLRSQKTEIWTLKVASLSSIPRGLGVEKKSCDLRLSRSAIADVELTRLKKITVVKSCKPTPPTSHCSA